MATLKLKRETKVAMNWEEIERFLALGIADTVFRVGDQIIVEHDELGKIAFDILDFDKEKIAGNQMHSITLQAHELVFEDKEFDAQGCNKWEKSSLRKYINSEEFIDHFEKGFTDMLVDVYKANDDREITKDKFFILSLEEMTEYDFRYDYYRNRANMIKTTAIGYAEPYHTRTAKNKRESEMLVWEIETSAEMVGFHTATNEIKYAPACVIAK